MDTHVVSNRVGSWMAGILVALFGMAGCSGGAGGSSSLIGTASGTAGTTSGSTQASTGAALVTLTDAPGDFLSYLVNVVSLQLTRADGTVVQTVPTKTQVDFAQLVNLSEVISALQIPSGNYTAASLTLDYTNATIVIDNGAGGVTVPAANILNGSTKAALVAPNNQITVSLQLPTNSPLIVTPGSIANLALDFNLATSNTVAPAPITASTAANSISVTVNPVLTASLVPDTTKQIRVRGTLVSVTNTAAATSYTIDVQPFWTEAGNQGQVTVDTTATTTFTLNGTSYTGTAGLTALAALAAGTQTTALGTFDVSTKTFTATSVTAGSSTVGSTLDSVEGTVVARSGNVLAVSAGLVGEHDLTGVQFRSEVSVTLGATTTVTEQGQTGTYGPQDVSVGQRARFFGIFATDSTGNATLDATKGSVQLIPTALIGTVTAGTATSLTLSVTSIDNQPASAFTFAGTGASSAQDAVATSYVVSVPTGLFATPPAVGSPVKLVGFATPFGSAPPDFSALSLVNYSNTNARLHLRWAAPGDTAPFAAPATAANVVVSQAAMKGAAEHVVGEGPVRLDPSTLASGLTLAADNSATNSKFAIAHATSQTIDTYSTFADWLAALNTDVNGTTALLEVDALGTYSSTAATFSVDEIAVLLND